MFGKLGSKTCAALLLAAGLLISLGIAYRLGSAWSWEDVWVAVERSADAIPSHLTQQQNIPKRVGLTAAVFSVGAVVSFLAAELYYSILEFFRTAPNKKGSTMMPDE